MSMNEQERLAWQEQAYGCRETDLRKAIEGYHVTKMIWIAGACSDAQELMNMASQESDQTKRAGFLETARQYLNRAKWGMFEYLEEKSGEQKR